jgi:hypothetical protein
MALTVTKTTLLRYIGRKLGYNRTSSSFTSTQSTDAVDVLNDALRRFYGAPGHQWSFLCPTVPFGLTEGQWRYDLPEDFSMLKGPLSYERGTDACYPPIEITSPERIRRDQQHNDSSARPYRGAIETAPPVNGLATRYQLIVYPTADADYTVNLTYKINPYSLDEDSALPLGGDIHVQTIISACLAAAADFDEYEGDKYEARFREHMAASIAFDQKLSAPETLGINYDTSDSQDIYSSPNVRVQSWGNIVTYDGESY